MAFRRVGGVGNDPPGAVPEARLFGLGGALRAAAERGDFEQRERMLRAFVERVSPASRRPILAGSRGASPAGRADAGFRSIPYIAHRAVARSPVRTPSPRVHSAAYYAGTQAAFDAATARALAAPQRHLEASQRLNRFARVLEDAQRRGVVRSRSRSRSVPPPDAIGTGAYRVRGRGAYDFGAFARKAPLPMPTAAELAVARQQQQIRNAAALAAAGKGAYRVRGC